MTKFFIIILVSFSLFQTSCTSPMIVEDEKPFLDDSQIAPSGTGQQESDEQTDLASTNLSPMKYWDWSTIDIPSYSWADGIEFGDDLFVNIAFDPNGVRTEGNKLRFHIDPYSAPSGTPSPFSYRSEIHTAPWPINHPLGTEQWIGWEYTFGDNYVIDPTSPITIFQNHPGINGLSPQLEIEIAGLNNPSPAIGGELQVINEASSDRILYPIRPEAGDHLEIVIHVIYGLGNNGLFQVWFNDELYYDEKTSTVYQDYPWGGNNKWGIYHHTFNNSASDVQSSVDIGAGKFDLFMSPLRLITRTPDHKEYGLSAYDLVRPKF